MRREYSGNMSPEGKTLGVVPKEEREIPEGVEMTEDQARDLLKKYLEEYEERGGRCRNISRIVLSLLSEGAMIESGGAEPPVSTEEIKELVVAYHVLGFLPSEKRPLVEASKL